MKTCLQQIKLVLDQQYKTEKNVVEQPEANVCDRTAQDDAHTVCQTGADK